MVSGNDNQRSAPTYSGSISEENLPRILGMGMAHFHSADSKEPPSPKGRISASLTRLAARIICSAVAFF